MRHQLRLLRSDTKRGRRMLLWWRMTRDVGLSLWYRRRRIWRRQTATEPWILPTVFPPNCGQPKKERANLRHRQTIFGTAPLIVHQCTPIVVSNYEQL